MLSTFTDYRMISANLQKSMSRTAAEGTSKKEIQYFRDHIGTVKTVDDFLGNNRLYTFAMKAYGLDDMIYAKGFMKKVLLGEADANGRVLVTRLQDGRYRNFAAAFNFRALGDDPNRIQRSDNPEIQAILDAMAPKKSLTERLEDYDSETERSIGYVRAMAELNLDLKDIASDYKLSQIVRTTVGLPPASDADDVQTQMDQLRSRFDPDTFRDANRLSDFISQFIAVRHAGSRSVVDPYFRPAGTFADSDAEIETLVHYFQAKVSTVHAAKDIVGDPALAYIARTALGLSAETGAMSFNEQTKLIGRKLDVSTLQDPKTRSQFLNRFRNARDAARTATVDAYIRQTLETKAGEENQGVRLALYFRRMAPTVTSAYGLLADPALAEVVRTALGLPAQAAKSSVDGQARLIQRKLDVASLKDPAKLDAFIKRFTVLWDAKTGAAPTPTLSLLSSAGPGLDPDALIRLQAIRMGGR